MFIITMVVTFCVYHFYCFFADYYTVTYSRFYLIPLSKRISAPSSEKEGPAGV